MNIKSINSLKPMAILAMAAFIMTGCDSQVYDYLEPCHTEHYLKFRYDYNIKDADAFRKEVESVAVWAFDSDGRLAWQYKEEGDALKEEGYKVDVPLRPGTYDFVTWCGLSKDSPFILDTETPATITDLGITLTLSDQTRADGRVSDVVLPSLFHAITRQVDFTDDPSVASSHEIGLSLTKDTNYIKILLQNTDGTEMKRNDFTFRITRGNDRLEHDNEAGTGDTFDYKPWDLTSTEGTVLEDGSGEGTITSVSGVLAEMHMSRIMKDGDYHLVVTRNEDSHDIIDIPLVDYLLLVKGNYRRMTDQEYLDRQDEYSIIFLLDSKRNWMKEFGIYVNAWHVVPPQDSTLQ